MQNFLENRIRIMDLINGWIHRDLRQWDQLRELFHPGGSIEVTWFEGPFEDFVDGSMRMSASDLVTKHLIGAPVVDMNGNKAVAETNAIVVVENMRMDLGCNAHTRFFDLVEKRDGVWKLLKRWCIYDMCAFTFPQGLVEIDRAIVANYPREYAALGYILEKSGFPVKRLFATRGSELEQSMKAEAKAWLAS